MLAVVVSFEAKPDRIDDFRVVITGHAQKSLEREPDCRQFDVAQDPADPSRFFLYEVYDDEAALEAHRASAHMAETGQKIPDLIVSRSLQSYTLLVGQRVKR